MVRKSVDTSCRLTLKPRPRVLPVRMEPMSAVAAWPGLGLGLRVAGLGLGFQDGAKDLRQVAGGVQALRGVVELILIHVERHDLEHPLLGWGEG
eukprot:scaffold79663_cov40-Phaeocystis_antarctica.AAC.1